MQNDDPVRYGRFVAIGGDWVTNMIYYMAFKDDREDVLFVVPKILKPSIQCGVYP